MFIATFLVWIGAVLSSWFGLAGGMISLSALVMLFGLKTAIPLHSVITFFSDLVRVVIFFRSIDWKIVRLYSIFLIPGSYLGVYCFQYLNESVLLALLGFLVFFTSIKILLRNAEAVHSSQMSAKKILGLSFVTGFLGTTVGATGPLVASVFVRHGLIKEKLIGTKSACQFILQLVKIIFFVYLVNFEYSEYAPSLILFLGAVFLGSYIGKFLVGIMSEETHKKIVAGILICLSINFIVKSLNALF